MEKIDEIEVKIRCGHCGNFAPMRGTLDRCGVVDQYNKDLKMIVEEGPVFELLHCPSCNGVVLREGYHADYYSEEDAAYRKVIYPPTDRTPSGLPRGVGNAYEAAVRVRTVDANAYAVLLGRVLDKVCEDRKADGQTLFNKLQNLAERGEIPGNLAEMAQSLRQLRNVGAHADLGELTAEEIPFLDDLCRAILEYVYSAPTLIAKAQATLEKLRSNGEQ